MSAVYRRRWERVTGDFGAHVRIHATPSLVGRETRRLGGTAQRESETEREKERDRDGRRSWLRDEERVDQYRAIHAEVISLSTVSGGSRVAWRRGVARCWCGMAWHGVAWRGMVLVWRGVRAPAVAPRSISLPRTLFSPFLPISLIIRLVLYVFVHVLCCLSFAFSASTALDRPPDPLLRG